MEFKDKIIELRKENNISQEKLAEKIGISRQAIAKWESGEAYPDINNLIALSEVFNISIDRLLKNDNCIKSITEKNINRDKLIEFLIEAKKNTYAGNKEQQSISSRPNSHDLIYEKGKFKYIDSYLGGQRFIGQEVVYENETPIWAMNYYGIEISDKFSGSFLKQALSNIPKDKPYRGPHIFKVGEYIYVCESSGNFQYFKGKEQIFCGDEKIFECIFNGGIIK